MSTTYYNSSLRVTITRCNDLPQLSTTSYHNSLKRVMVTRNRHIQTEAQQTDEQKITTPT
ncbi:hypothetical protein HMPREF9134_00124 [Porphyromonas catoniae F0037]|uniref:Uncharacterized protein n=1 Tax=Porphyromonas catoniae F0037 TaxID=1127696 RepID=L1NJ53_9PORP|nr:hypothetical protein HMPREF9134_00124 [Porphyromonas catoniae F0037]